MTNGIPYIVSADIKILLERWIQDKGFVLPPDSFFSLIRNEFTSFMQKIFPSFELVEDKELLEGMKSITEEESLPLISLDRTYITTHFHIDIARDVDQRLWSKQEKSVYQQFLVLRKQGWQQVALVDDVIFSGSLLERIIQVLNRMDISVPTAYAAIGVQEGITKIKQLGTNVRCLHYYQEVKDEVCERDFFPGVPLCGRLSGRDYTTGIPYLLPFGNPGQWASIPKEWQLPFSQFCLGQTIKLFEAIEIASNRKIACCDLERKVVGLPTDNTRYVDILRTLL